MKIRNGFVSNSSSSSFTCAVCNRTEEGTDYELEYADMYECVNGHVFCTKHAVKYMRDPDILKKEQEEDIRNQIERSDWLPEIHKETVKKILNLEELLKYIENYDLDGQYNVNLEEKVESGYNYPAESCPICQFKRINITDYIKILIRDGKYQSTLSEMKERFGDSGSIEKYTKTVNLEREEAYES